MDPWECYQDTWQTTCSVLEHHRDLMKVSWPRRGVGDHRHQAGCGKGAAGLLTWFGLRFLTNQAPSRHGRAVGEAPRAAPGSAPGLLPLLDLTWGCFHLLGASSRWDEDDRQTTSESEARRRPGRERQEKGGPLGGGTSSQVLLPHLFGTQWSPPCSTGCCAEGLTPAGHCTVIPPCSSSGSPTGRQCPSSCCVSG